MVANPKQQDIRVSLSFRATRREDRNPPDAPAGTQESPQELSRWLQPDRLVPLDDFVRKLAAEVTAGKTTDVEKARAIYDYAVTNLKYDKSGTGWGRGDIYYACDAKRGNCTDFHALVIGLARAVGIPARFDIGFPLPTERGEGDIAGYHCWAKLYLKGHGWVPVDASEANKHPEKREYFFGTHDENRIKFTTGRDLVLNPPQAGSPLNFFIYPYVEVDGRPLEGVTRSVHYRDVGDAMQAR
jgi:transglutaminase-like putative cysteine protease